MLNPSSRSSRPSRHSSHSTAPADLYVNLVRLHAKNLEHFNDDELGTSRKIVSKKLSGTNQKQADFSFRQVLANLQQVEEKLDKKKGLA